MFSGEPLPLTCPRAAIILPVWPFSEPTPAVSYSPPSPLIVYNRLTTPSQTSRLFPSSRIQQRIHHLEHPLCGQDPDQHLCHADQRLLWEAIDRSLLRHVMCPHVDRYQRAGIRQDQRFDQGGLDRLGVLLGRRKQHPWVSLSLRHAYQFHRN